MLDDVSALLLVAGNPDLEEGERVAALVTLGTYYPLETPHEAVLDVYQRDGDLRLVLIHALAAFGSAAPLSVLHQALHDPDPLVLTMAITVFGQTHPAAALEPLLAFATDHPLREVRHEALRTLGSMADRRALPLILAALHADEQDLRALAAWAIGQLQDATLADHLIPLLHDTPWVLGMALGVLTRLAPHVVEQEAPALLAQPNPGVRVTVIEVLASAGEVIPRSWFVSLLADPVAFVRVAARAALARRDALP